MSGCGEKDSGNIESSQADEIMVVLKTIKGVKVTSVDDCAFEGIKSNVRGLDLTKNIETVDTYSTLCNFEKLEVLILGESMSDIPRASIINNPSLQYIKFMCLEI